MELEKEKESILNNQNLIEEVEMLNSAIFKKSNVHLVSFHDFSYLQEKEKLLIEMNKKQDLLHKEQEARDKLAQKIKAMESKLLCGGKNIIDHTNEQQRELELRRQEIAEQTVRNTDLIYLYQPWLSCN